MIFQILYNVTIRVCYLIYKWQREKADESTRYREVCVSVRQYLMRSFWRLGKGKEVLQRAD